MFSLFFVVTVLSLKLLRESLVKYGCHDSRFLFAQLTDRIVK
jgi:hypothetical protein